MSSTTARAETEVDTVSSDLFSKLLLLKDVHDEHREDGVLQVTAWITSAIRDTNPDHPLREVYRAVIHTGTRDLLDPLQILPILLPSNNPAADDFVSLIAECSSAKEVVIAAQEAVEQLQTALDEGDDDEANTLSLPSRLDRLINLYGSALPRLKLRKKPAAETIAPYLSELRNALIAAAAYVNASQAPQICMSMSQLVIAAASWATNVCADAEQLESCFAVLSALVTTTLTALQGSVHTHLAQRRFRQIYPRLRMTDELGTAQEATDAVATLQTASDAVGRTGAVLAETPSLASLILLAHSDEPMSHQTFSNFLPVIISCLHANAALDSTLALLLSSISASPLPSISPESAFNLTYTLAMLSAAHPDPATRHIAFRVVALTLPLSPATQQLTLLCEMLRPSKDTPPQLRVAAVGLARDTILRALGDPAPSPLASPLTLQALGPLVLRPDPPDLFADPAGVDLTEFCETPELKRLTECLGFYYVLHMRDTADRIGIRSDEMKRTVDRNLLAPLRNALQVWSTLGAVQDGHHVDMALAGLSVNLQRIDDALRSD